MKGLLVATSYTEWINEWMNEMIKEDKNNNNKNKNNKNSNSKSLRCSTKSDSILNMIETNSI